MAKSYALQALRVFSFEEMLKLSNSVQVKTGIMKKAAGAELVIWSDAPEEEALAEKKNESDENVLPFKKKSFSTLDHLEHAEENKVATSSEESKNFYSSEFLLWQRELGKEIPGLHKKEAAQGYAKSTEMYVVNTPALDGKEKIRFASTNGVLVDKKQA